MQLTQHTDFGLRLLIVLARDDGHAISLPTFAEAQGISYHHVAKVAQALRRQGIIATRRGRSGGVELARPASLITLGEVVRTLENGLQLADCAHCALRADCATSPMLAEALNAFLEVLDRKTLAEAARPDGGVVSAWL